MFRFLKITTFPSGRRWFDMGSPVNYKFVCEELDRQPLAADKPEPLVKCAGGWATSTEFVVYDGSA